MIRVLSRQTATYGSVTSLSCPKHLLMLNMKLSVSGRSRASWMSTSSSPCKKGPSRSRKDFRRKSASCSRLFIAFHHAIIARPTNQNLDHKTEKKKSRKVCQTDFQLLNTSKSAVDPCCTLDSYHFLIRHFCHDVENEHVNSQIKL